MILSQLLAQYTLKQADALRKTVAKKKMNEISKQKELFYSQCEGTQEVKDYLWRVVIQPSLGYGFSLNHALPYSIIGVQCILMGGILFPPIYWQCACLLQRSGALDGKGANYNKIAKAVAALAKQGVNITPIDINISERDFAVDREHNTIHYGLAGIKGLKDKVMDKIFELRPFDSLLDFISKTGADVTSIVALVKSGAFDNFYPGTGRGAAIQELADVKGDTKSKLNGQNLLMLSRENLWPEDTEELKYARRIFNFTHYMSQLKSAKQKELNKKIEYYPLNKRCTDFLDEIGYKYEAAEYSDEIRLPCVLWKSYSDTKILPIKQYLIDHQEEMLKKANDHAIKVWLDKYFPADQGIAQWEIETMGLCFADHPMSHVVNVSDFETLPSEPEVGSMFKTPSGRVVPIYKLTMIAGIVIAKDKLHSSITLLTATGPVEVKFRKQQFAAYDKQVSKVVDGKKKVVEKSWLNRGVGLIIHGMRQDDIFLAKTYKNSPMHHTAYKVTEILPSGKLKVQKERKSGTLEDSNENDD